MINPHDVKRMTARHQHIIIKAKTPIRQDKPTWPYPFPGIVYTPPNKSRVAVHDENAERNSKSALSVFKAFAKLWR